MRFGRLGTGPGLLGEIPTGTEVSTHNPRRPTEGTHHSLGVEDRRRDVEERWKERTEVYAETPLAWECGGTRDAEKELRRNLETAPDSP